MNRYIKHFNYINDTTYRRYYYYLKHTNYIYHYIDNGNKYYCRDIDSIVRRFGIEIISMKKE